ncbi:hypothetical protein NDU88_005064 [Pleurodeles waltl]|uniref:Uncharacterized protein n=1 Tax=Pleurodeles waltl TaxID=8319 RepID=A0AAV7NP59_PLEWA|nr:hypothetical protein NDU88_005064 [Pleurodeles waltl]
MVAGRLLAQGTDAEEGHQSKEEESIVRLQEAGDSDIPLLFIGDEQLMEAKELAGAQDTSEHGVVPLLRASLELFRVRDAVARVSYRANQGKASTGPDPSGKKSRILRIPQLHRGLGDFRY